MKKFVKTIILLAFSIIFLVGTYLSIDSAQKEDSRWILWTCAFLLWASSTATGGSLIHIACWQILEKKHGQKVPRLFRLIVIFSIGIVVAAIMAETVFHTSIKSLWAASAFSGLGLILSAKDVLKDVISGVVLNLDQPFRINDRIRISLSGGASQEGHVIDIDWRSTTLRTLSGDTVVIPNSVVSESAVVNMVKGSRPECCEFKLQLDPEAPVDLVRKSIINSALNVPVVLKSPAPVVLINSLQSWCVEYSVQFYFESSTTSIAIARDMVITSVLEQMRRNRIGMASQKHEILMQQRGSVPSRNWE